MSLDIEQAARLEGYLSAKKQIILELEERLRKLDEHYATDRKFIANRLNLLIIEYELDVAKFLSQTREPLTRSTSANEKDLRPRPRPRLIPVSGTWGQPQRRGPDRSK